MSTNETTSLALHQITLLGRSPFVLVAVAAELGCDGVCVFVNAPAAPGRPPFPVVTREMLPEMRARLDACAVKVRNAEYFPIRARIELDAWLPALEIAAQLGAERIVTHLHDPDPRRGIANLARLCELAGGFGLDVGLEMLPISPGCATIEAALDVLRQARCPNLGLGVDALHFFRSAAQPAQLRDVDPALLSYGQLCDGLAPLAFPRPVDMSLYLEAAFDRLAPGQGDYPLVEWLASLPASLALDVEVPALRLGLGRETPELHAARAVEGARRVLALARQHT